MKIPAANLAEKTPVPLPASFYGPSAAIVAPRLLGHFLIRKTPAGLSAGIIVETEAYLADDPASHGFRRETARNRSMFGPPGRAYVYFIYGHHWCCNAVCRAPGVAEAVLIRAIQPVLGEDWMRANRAGKSAHELTNGPAKLCAALNIDRTLDGADLCDAISPLFIAENPDVKQFRYEHGPVVTTTRIGLSVAEKLPLRFYLGGSEFVSRREQLRAFENTIKRRHVDTPPPRV